MLTLQQAREIDPTLNDLSDRELTEVLAILHQLAEIAVFVSTSGHDGSKVREGSLEE
jgi:hypothetical protein